MVCFVLPEIPSNKEDGIRSNRFQAKSIEERAGDGEAQSFRHRLEESGIGPRGQKQEGQGRQRRRRRKEEESRHQRGDVEKVAVAFRYP